VGRNWHKLKAGFGARSGAAAPLDAVVDRVGRAQRAFGRTPVYRRASERGYNPRVEPNAICFRDRKADRRRPALSLRNPIVFGCKQRPRWRERMDELTSEGIGHGLIDPVAFRPRLGQVMGAENAIEPGKH
jgi:hypothetical protein